MAEGLADANPYPLTHPVGFNIAAEAVDREPVPVVVPQSILTEEEEASGRLWSARVVLVSGIAEEALHAANSKHFQVPAGPTGHKFHVQGFQSV